jgi:hypothetical protein
VTYFAFYAIPGLIYFVNNNCLFYILQVLGFAPARTAPVPSAYRAPQRTPRARRG